MFKYSLKILLRQKGYSIINILGLAISMACSMFIALYVFHELSYDRFNKKEDRLYRLVVNGIIGDREVSYAVTSAPVGPTMLNEFPEVENFVRLNTIGDPTVNFENIKYTETGFMEADSTFFDVFSISLIKGDKKHVLDEPYELVISETTAGKLFKNDDPVGRTLTIGRNNAVYRISGIMQDIPSNSHFTANMIGSFMTNESSNDPYWGNNNYATYILLKSDDDHDRVNSRMPEMIKRYIGPIAHDMAGISIEEFINKYKYNIHLQPIKDIHFDVETIRLANTKQASNKKYLYIFACVALLIIIIAAVNFTNLSTAQAIKRAREVGIKRASGSGKMVLVKQFLSESMILTFIALLLAIIIVENLLPSFGNLLGIELQLNIFGSWYILPLLLFLAFIVGLLSGSYPAFYLSSFNPVSVLKGKPVEKTRIGRLRSSLVIVQFVISIILIAGTSIMVRQIRFMLNKDLGFKKEQLLVISQADLIGERAKPFLASLMKLPDVTIASASTDVPGHSGSGKTFTVDGRSGDVMDFRVNFVDYNFFETYGIKLSSGRTFNEEFSDEVNRCVINESTVKHMSLPDPLNTSFSDGFIKLSVAGVVKDFHYESLQSGINPYLFILKTDSINYGYFTVKLTPTASGNTLKGIENLWNEFAPSDPFNYFFIDQDFEQKYKQEKQSARLAIIFSIMALLIASMGLFGLMSFNLEQRTKEIGIRKVLGASVPEIFYQISKELLVLLGIATILSIPVIYLVMKHWLESFYYRINLQPSDFITACAVAVIVAFSTIIYRIIKSTRMDPIQALRYE